MKISSDIETDNRENEDEAAFDTFILRNFTLFSKQGNVIEGLHNTSNKFNLFETSRNLRYISVSLLIEADAKRTYIRKSNQIESFDGFHEFLLNKLIAMLLILIYTVSNLTHYLILYIKIIGMGKIGVSQSLTHWVTAS